MCASRSHSYTHLILALGIIRESTIWGFITSQILAFMTLVAYQGGQEDAQAGRVGAQPAARPHHHTHGTRIHDVYAQGLMRNYKLLYSVRVYTVYTHRGRCAATNLCM